MQVEAPPILATGLLIVGTATIVACLCKLLIGRTTTKFEGTTPALNAAVLFTLVFLIAAGGYLRYNGLETRGMTHVEVYVPGLELPSDVSTPPARHTFGEVLWYHFHDEPHPQGYYFVMHGWTKMFGTSLESIRLPSLIFNLLSLVILFLLVRREAGWGVGLFAAGIFALHGHQIYWSQQARMYAMGQFCGLASTYFLFTMLRSKRSGAIELGYVLVTLLGVGTKIFFWPFLAAQMFLVACLRDSRSQLFIRIFSLQAIVVTLGTPFWTHALYRARNAPLDGPSWEFTKQYFALGNLFERDLFSLPNKMPPETYWLLALVLTGVGILLAFDRKMTPPQATSEEAIPLKWRAMTAVGASLFILGLANAAYRRQIYLYGSAILPIACLFLPWFQTLVAKTLGRLMHPLIGKSRAMPFLLLSITPFVLLMIVAIKSPLLKSRGMITFTPYLMAAVAVGWSRLMVTRRVWQPLLITAVFAWTLVMSERYFASRPEPNDHRSMTANMAAEFDDSDLVFIKKNDWVTTPSLYHLYDDRQRLVAEDWAARAKAAPLARIWVLEYSDIPRVPAIAEALRSRKSLKTIESRRCRAELFGPED